MGGRAVVGPALRPCGPPRASTSEVLTVKLDGGGELREPIDGCAGAPYDQLRSLWLYLRGRYGVDSACTRDSYGRAPFSCHRGSIGGGCEDVGLEPLCDRGKWRCHNGTSMVFTPLVPSNQCGCLGHGRWETIFGLGQTPFIGIGRFDRRADVSASGSAGDRPASERCPSRRRRRRVAARR